jgi:hypothetical protein
MHPVIWLKDDTTWLGGASWPDPAMRRLVILLDVGQKHVSLPAGGRLGSIRQHLPASRSHWSRRCGSGTD